MSLLVGVVVYNRFDNIRKWAHAWRNAIKPEGARMAVFHNYDGFGPPKLTLYEGYDGYYIPRHNVGCDLGALQDVIKGSYCPGWDQLAWFVDDFVPMKRDFLLTMAERLSSPNVGLVGACFEPANESNKHRHFRTVGFMSKREVLERLVFPADPMKTRQDAFEMEHGPNNMTIQIENMGFETVPAIGNKFPEPGYSHWPNNSEWMWDCSMLAHLDLWPVFEREFK